MKRVLVSRLSIIITTIFLLLLIIIIRILYYYNNDNNKNDYDNNDYDNNDNNSDIFIKNYQIKRKEKVSRICSKKFLDEVNNYTKFHAEAIEKLINNNENDNDIKLIIYRCPLEYKDDCKGLGDRLQGLVTTFLIAIVTRRVMLIEWNGINTIFSPNTFNWTYIPSLIQNKKSIGGVGGTLEWKYCQNLVYNDLCMNPDPNNYTSSDVIILNAINRPMSYLFFNDKRYQWWNEQLTSIGITHDWCFSCVLDQLIQPKKILFDKYLSYATQIHNSNTLSIGIHYRLGDSEMTGHSKLKMKDYKVIFQNDIIKRFETAQKLICNYSNNSNSNIILFLSDSIQLRKMVRDYYYNNVIDSKKMDCFSKKIIVPSTIPKHIDTREYKIKYMNEYKQIEMNKQRHYAYVTSAGEWFLFSLCNIIIIEGDVSGFSRTSFAYSLNSGANYKGEIYLTPGKAKLGHFEQGL